MLRELYSAGILSPDEFQRIDLAAQMRNQTVHGFSARPADAATSGTDVVGFLIEITRRLVSESQPARQTA
jgi:hypothetical protein